jgi:hypothetical protein
MFFEEKLLSKTLHDVPERPETDPELVLSPFADLQHASWRVYHVAGISPGSGYDGVVCTKLHTNIAGGDLCCTIPKALLNSASLKCRLMLAFAICKKCKPLKDNKPIISPYNKRHMSVHPIKNMKTLGCMLSLLNRRVGTD